MNLRRTLPSALGLLAVTAVLVTGAAVTARTAPLDLTPAAPPATHAGLRLHAKAPNTPAGYRAMFARVPVTTWGGGDIAQTTRLPGGRVVWVFGDTLSRRHGFVHSSALVQSGGVLHVSAAGHQLLPNGATTRGRTTIYWPEKVALSGHGLTVWATPISIGHAGPWDFHRIGTRSRVARVSITSAGDLTFRRWTGYAPRPAGATRVDGSDTRILGPHHYAYQRTVHPELRLTGGAHLVTWSQSWDDAIHADLRDYRPIFTSD
jgi:hypothetical protein